MQQARAWADAVTRDNVALVDKIRCVACVFYWAGVAECRSTCTC